MYTLRLTSNEPFINERVHWTTFSRATFSKSNNGLIMEATLSIRCCRSHIHVPDCFAEEATNKSRRYSYRADVRQEWKKEMTCLGGGHNGICPLRWQASRSWEFLGTNLGLRIVIFKCYLFRFRVNAEILYQFITMCRLNNNQLRKWRIYWKQMY